MAREYEVTTTKKLISRLLGNAAKLGLGNFIVLTTTGRRSDEQRQVTLAPISDEDGEYLVSPYGDSAWVLNVRSDSRATIRRGASEEAVRLVEVTGEKPGLVKEYYEREAFARRFMDVPEGATLEDFASGPERFPVFRIDAAG